MSINVPFIGIFDQTVDNFLVKHTLIANQAQITDLTATSITATSITATNLTSTNTTTTNLVITGTFNNPLLVAKGDLLTSNGTQNIVLHVGNNGDVLSADSTQTSGLVWIPPSSLPSNLPTTTKGDLIVRDSTTNVRLPVGADGQFLEADSSQSTGVRWQYPVHQGKGNLLTSNGTVAMEFPVGTNGQMLTADSATISGLNWSTLTPLSITATYRTGVKTSNQSVPGTTPTLMTWQSFDSSPNFTSFNVPITGLYLCFLNMTWQATGDDIASFLRVNGSNYIIGWENILPDSGSSHKTQTCLTIQRLTATQAIEWYVYATDDTTIIGTTTVGSITPGSITSYGFYLLSA